MKNKHTNMKQRLISVIFTNRKIKNRYTFEMKKYIFLCPYDIIKVGDMIEDDRYHGSMQVIALNDYTEEQIASICISNRITGSTTLKTIKPSKINGKEVCFLETTSNDNMEGRSITVTLQQALEWYNSGNSALRTLAMSTYTKGELELNYPFIVSKVDQIRDSFDIPLKEHKNFKTLAKLATIAKYFNKEWRKTTSNTGYFIGNYNESNGPVVENLHSAAIYKHETVQYSGVIYFKNQEDVVKAIKILGDEVAELFK